MTGSATKHSRVTRVALECFASLAMTEKNYASRLGGSPLNQASMASTIWL
jgi:hypothetical protein